MNDSKKATPAADRRRNPPDCGRAVPYKARLLGPFKPKEQPQLGEGGSQTPKAA